MDSQQPQAAATPPRKHRPDARRGRARKKGPPRVQVEISAGGIVYKRTRKGLKMSLMLDPFGKWTFAKGHVEPGETIEHAALRETAEEMALRGLKLRLPLGTIDFWFREKYRPGSKGMLVHKFVHYFLMEAPAGEWGSPQKNEKIRQIVWVDPREAMQKSSYEDVRPVLEKALITLGIMKPPAEGASKPKNEKPRP
ncbi:MAG: NUDIX domain-containing protein [Patescibacteria group bacterium]|nr:MAG: NUDIX domain-containing protein [Patescibacteria group bacterium]